MTIMTLILLIVCSTITLFLGFTLGLFFASKFDFAFRVGARNDMEFYAEEMRKRMEEDAEAQIKSAELFPPTLRKDYGLPHER